MLVYDIRIKVVLTLGRERQGEAKEGAFWCDGNVLFVDLEIQCIHVGENLSNYSLMIYIYTYIYYTSTKKITKNACIEISRLFYWLLNLCKKNKQFQNYMYFL